MLWILINDESLKFKFYLSRLICSISWFMYVYIFETLASVDNNTIYNITLEIKRLLCNLNRSPFQHMNSINWSVLFETSASSCSRNSSLINSMHVSSPYNIQSSPQLASFLVQMFNHCYAIMIIARILMLVGKNRLLD